MGFCGASHEPSGPDLLRERHQQQPKGELEMSDEPKLRDASHNVEQGGRVFSDRAFELASEPVAPTPAKRSKKDVNSDNLAAFGVLKVAANPPSLTNLGSSTVGQGGSGPNESTGFGTTSRKP
jgi:hypothetical protein